MLETRAVLCAPDGEGPHPVLCFLHGAGEAAKDGLDRLQPLDKVLEHRSPPWHASNGSAFASRFLVVAPQLEKLRPWEASDAPMIDAIVRGAIAELRGDASRVALTGFSFGGEGAFQVASASRLPWSAIWAVDPALFRIPPLPAPDVRVWVHHGRAQPGSTNMPEFARALGLEPWRGAPDARRILTVLDADHAATCVEAYAAAHVYDWLA